MRLIPAVAAIFLALATLSDATDRSLRGSDNGHTFSFQNVNDDGDLEERAPVGDLEAFASPQHLKWLKGTITKASISFGEKVSPAMPLRMRLKFWNKHDKPVDFVRTELGMDKLTGEAFKAARNYKLYDDYVMLQLPKWTQNDLAPDEIVKLLGLPRLTEEVKTNPSFKYYDEFLNLQVLPWGQKDLGPSDIFIRLGLNRLPWAEVSEAINFKYYNEFVLNQIQSWLKNDEVSPVDAMKKLNLDKLTGRALYLHPNYEYYKSFVERKLNSWAMDGVSMEHVKSKLGLEKLKGPALTRNSNYHFYASFVKQLDEFRNNGWLKQEFTTYDVWKKMDLTRLSSIRQATFRNTVCFKIYASYVNTMDDYILKLMKKGETIPNLIENVDEIEIRVKTQIWTAAKRPDDYVRYSLGLSGLDDAALKEAKNYKFYEKYLNGLPFID